MQHLATVLLLRGLRWKSRTSTYMVCFEGGVGFALGRFEPRGCVSMIATAPGQHIPSGVRPVLQRQVLHTALVQNLLQLASKPGCRFTAGIPRYPWTLATWPSCIIDARPVHADENQWMNRHRRRIAHWLQNAALTAAPVAQSAARRNAEVQCNNISMMKVKIVCSFGRFSTASAAAAASPAG
jgi:hypothetical protein